MIPSPVPKPSQHGCKRMEVSTRSNREKRGEENVTYYSMNSMVHVEKNTREESWTVLDTLLRERYIFKELNQLFDELQLLQVTDKLMPVHLCSRSP